jgi:hypothetical protein
MIYTMDHKEHGRHFCYTPEDVEAHKLHGWYLAVEEKEPDQTIIEKKRGRPRHDDSSRHI